MKNQSVDKIRDLINEMADGRSTGKRLMLDSKSGKLVEISKDEDAEEQMIELTCEEANMFAIDETVFIIMNDDIDKLLKKCEMERNEETLLKLSSIDDGDVLRVDANGKIKAKFYDITNNTVLEKHIIETSKEKSEVIIFFNKAQFSIKCYWKKEDICKQLKVIIPPVKEEIFSRVNGVYETAVLSDKKVVIIGLGSGGSPIALELAKQGVQHFLLIDPDRLEIGNISRHICGMSDLGRFKTKAVSDIIKNKNPYADIITLEKDIAKMKQKEKERYFDDVDLVICCTDSRESKLIINRFCIEYKLPCLYGGAFRRAYGGQVLRVIPHKTMCYQCYISSMPSIANDNEISSQRQTDRIAYSDIPDIPIEPGLSTDIAPISIFIVKLAILQLLRGYEHTMQSLYEDLEASLYFWFNRREIGTQWEKALNAMEYTTDRMSILRWYGVYTKINEECPVCGKYFHNINSTDIEFFG
ncbi:MAG: ThiF family adenylyltransferase [Eubacterium sp.]|nr:ThiF family adenylyltransferase [Eubacterium sp.]